MKITILNRLNAGKYQSKLPYIHIGIRTPGFKPIQVPVSEYRLGFLQLTFSDVDVKRDYPLDEGETEIIYFNKDHAKIILDFVRQHMFNVKEIVVNCEAGISRSSGVGAALSKLINGYDMEFFIKYTPNRLVYRTLLMEGMELSNGC